MRPRPSHLVMGALMFALVTACSGTPADPTPGAAEGTIAGPVTFPLPEPYTVSAFTHSEPGEELDQSLFMETMQERTNVVWELALNSSAEIQDKLGLSFSGGEYYDVYLKSGISEAQAAQFATQGIVIPLNDLIEEHMPNLTKALDDQGVWEEITSADGNIYSLPQLNLPGVAAPSLFINEPWLEEVGLDMPTTEDEFLAVLRAFRDQNPGGEAEVYPLYLPGGSVDMLLPYFGIAMDPNTNSTYDHAAGTISYVPTSDGFKQFLRVMSTAYSESLINENTFTATWDDLNALGMTRDVVGAFPQWGAFLVVGDRHTDFPMMMPFHPNSFPVNSGVGQGALVITDRASRPEVIAAWADTLYDEDGGRLCWMGVEGETYELNADGTYTWLTDGPYGADTTTIRNTQGLFGTQPAPCLKPAIFDEGQPDPFEQFLSVEREKIKAFGADPFPALTWTEEELADKSTLVADINPYILQFEAQVISGEIDLDSGWDAFLQTLNNMGLERLQAIDQAAYDRWLETNR